MSNLIETNVLTNLRAVLPETKIIEEETTSYLGNSGRVTVFPNTEDEIVNLLSYANSQNLKVNIEAGGTKKGFGGQNETADILLSLKEYKGIVEHTVGDMTLTVKAGTPFKELQDYLAGHKQKIALDPAWPELATVGGVIAANDSGPKRLGYGSARDAVIGLRTIYPDGTVIRSGGKVVKNVAGYDMNKLIIGSMGTLGVVSEVTVKLRPTPKFESLVLLSFETENLEEIKAFAVQLLDSMMEPISLELLNPVLSKKLTGKDTFTLAISLEDVESSVRYQEEYIKKLQPTNTYLEILQLQEAQAFWDRFYQISPNGIAVESMETEASLKIGVVNLDVLKVVKESQLLQDSHNLEVLAHGGLGHGLCQVNLKGSSEDIVSAIHQLRDSAKKLGGYAVVKHLPYELRNQVKVWGENPSYHFLLEGIKAKVDPNKILNSDRFVGGI